MSHRCDMVVGFLVPHRCERTALGRCVKCQRRFCEEHVQVEPAGLVCVACQQGLAQPVVMADSARTFDAADVAAFTAASTTADDAGETFADLS